MSFKRIILKFVALVKKNLACLSAGIIYGLFMQIVAVFFFNTFILIKNLKILILAKDVSDLIFGIVTSIVYLGLSIILGLSIVRHYDERGFYTSDDWYND